MNPESIIKYSLPVFVIAIVSRSIEGISYLYYAVPVFCLFYIGYYLLSVKRQIPKDRINKNEGDTSTPINETGTFFNLPLTIFLLPSLWFLITSLWSNYPDTSASRALYFLLISTGSVAAGILWIRFSGKGVLDFLLPANIFIVLICLFSLITNIPSNSWTGGHGKGYMGFFGHQNLLASVILFTLPAIVVKLINIVNKKSSSNYLSLAAYILLLTVNLLTLILTYSRASILSLLFGIFIFLMLSRKWKALTYSFVLISLLMITICSIPQLNKFADKIINKDFPELYSSRMWMWEPSFRAAIDGGLIGLGYGISDPNEKVGGTGDHFEGDRFVREKGNSTLALIEETGVIGLLLFILPIFATVILSAAKNLKLLTANYSLLTAALAAFILHSQFEAWWVGVGSVQLPLFFIYLGLVVQSSRLDISRLGSSKLGSYMFNV